MRPVKLLFISLLFFFGLLTAVGLLFPATVHISRAIDLRGQRKTDLMQRIVDASFQACWLGDSGQLLMKNGIRRTDSSIFVSLSNSKQQLGWVFHGTDGAIALRRVENAPLPRHTPGYGTQSFGIMLNRQSFSAQNLSMSKLLRTF